MLEQVAPQMLAAAVEHFQAAGDPFAKVLEQHAPAALAAMLDGARLAHSEGDNRGRALFLTDMAARFVMAAFETGEDATDDELRAVARRAVRLAALLLSEAEKLTGA